MKIIALTLLLFLTPHSKEVAYGDQHEWRNPKISQEIYTDSTRLAHISVELWVRVKGDSIFRYYGYGEFHTHRVSDGSISWGATFRSPTIRKP